MLLFKSAAFTDDPGVKTALAASTLVSRYMRIVPLSGILPDVKTTLPPPVVV